MIIRSTIDSDCQGQMYYVYQNQKEYLPKYKTRFSEYESEQLIKHLEQDPNNKNIYLYKIKYSDGSISLIANPNYPIGKIRCEDENDAI